MTVQLTADVEWLSETYDLGENLVHVSVYLICGDGGTILIDTGSFNDRDSIHEQLRDRTGGEIDAIVLTHADLPHSGNLATLRDEYADADVICGTSSPEIVGLGSSTKAPVGGSMAVAGRTLSFLHPPLADIQHSSWIYDHESGVLFTADGFGNYHTAADSERTTAEMGGPPTVEQVRAFHEDELLWLRYVDADKLIAALRRVFTERDVSYVAPIHGNPIAAADVPTYLDALETAVEQIVADADL
ncbi:MBL fold metallo-hydrolase [Haloferacaceae archaeon DSL9]